MKIAIGTDHRGFAHKEFIKQHMPSIEWVDVGTHSADRTDYPLYADKVVELMMSDNVDHGILLCASGGGMAIAANRHPHIYAVVAWSVEIARQCKAEDNANVLVLPSDFVTRDDAFTMIQAWLAESFKGGRYAERIAMIDKG
jgi:RpiB/LacA/LacB family sugar-phosphate isomerase